MADAKETVIRATNRHRASWDGFHGVAPGEVFIAPAIDRASSRCMHVMHAYVVRTTSLFGLCMGVRVVNLFVFASQLPSYERNKKSMRPCGQMHL